MSRNEASRLVHAVFRHLNLEEHRQAVIGSVADAFKHEPSWDRLPEARLVTEYLNQNKQSASESTENLIVSTSSYILALICHLSAASDCAALVSICEENDAVSRRVHEAVGGVLLDHAATVSQHRSATLESLSEQPSSANAALQSGLADPTQCFRFLTAYYRFCRLAPPKPESFDLIVSALRLLPVPDKPLVREASQMCIALIDCLPDSSSTDKAELPWLHTAWLLIWSYAGRDDDASLRSTALMLWLRLYSKLRPCDILEEPRYWDTLHAILSAGTHEQQKLALAIFRVSIAVFYGELQASVPRADVARQNLLQYSKYVTVYQAVVLDRYINQVQESLADLTLISKSDSGVSQRWLFALLQSALASTTQHSVRKAVGEWVLHTPELFINHRNIDSPALLQHAFLPWASMGNFFTSTITRLDDGKLSCSHGENLAALVTQILHQADSPETFHRLLRAILAFVESQGRYIFGHGRAFILEGVLSGISQTDAALDGEEVRLLSMIASISGFLEIAMDYMASLVAAILSPRPTPNVLGQRAAALNLGSSTDKKEKLSKDYGILTSLPVGPGQIPSASLQTALVAERPLEVLCSLIVKSEQKCLAGAGLLAGCSILRHAIDAINGLDLSSDELHLAVSALWDETEVQDFPRGALMALTSVLIHPRVVALCRSESKFTSLAKHILSELGQIAQGKVYVFSVLAEGWRLLVKKCPEQIDRRALMRFIEDFALNPPNVKIEFDLEAVVAAKLAQRVPGRSYEFYYGKDEGFAYACVFDMLNTLPQREDFSQASKELLCKTVRPWTEQKMPIPVYSDWKSTTQLQVMLMLLEYCLPDLNREEVSYYLGAFFQVLEIELLPRYRFLFEWMIARVLYHRPSHRSQILLKHSDMDIANPKLAISIIKLALMVARFPDTEASYGSELAVQLAVLSTCPKIVIRHESQWTFPQLWSLSQERGWSTVVDNAAFQRLDASIRSLDAFKNPPHGRMQENLDPVEDTNLSTLLAGYYMQIEPKEAPKARRRDFVAVTKTDLARDLPQAAQPLLPLGEAKKFQQRTKHGSTKKLEGTAQSASAPLQTKGNMSPDDMGKIPISLLDSSFPGSVRSRARPSPLIVVASLIDSHWNLGGLCRAAEILGAASMHVHSLFAVDTHAFTSVSVSSQSHLPIEQLSVSAISGFLTAKKVDGYEVVGIEQTDNSKILGAAGQRGARFKPDGKTVLVLGSEREGLPGELLADCDWCVEVRQKGITRSMNVQTAAAVVMYEYTRQMEQQQLEV